MLHWHTYLKETFLVKIKKLFNLADTQKLNLSWKITMLIVEEEEEAIVSACW